MSGKYASKSNSESPAHPFLMTQLQPSLRLASEPSAIESLISEMERTFEVKPAGSVRLERRYFDSYDWLAYAATTAVYTESRSGRTLLILESVETRDDRLRIPWNDAVALPSDLPAGPLREKLQDLLGPRALLPLVDVRVRRRSLRILGPERKTTVRLHVDTLEVSSVERGAARTGGEMTLVEVAPVRGYQKEAEAVLELAEAVLGPEQSPGSVFHHIVGAGGRRPYDTSSRFEIQLDPAERSDVAVKRVLSKLLETIEMNETGVIEQIDVEFLHDFRVAVRRTRSVLGQFRKVFPRHVVRRFADEFRTVGQATGPLRDMDVYLMRFEGYRSWLPTSVRDDLDPLHAFLEQRHGKEHRVVVRTLRSARYRRLISSWKLFLASPAGDPPPTPFAGLPILTLAARLTWKMYRRAVKQGRAILADPEGPADALHALRITCKKLRYLMELFRSLYPPDQIKGLIGVLKDLQDNLGNFQDYSVQQAHLLTFGREMVQEGMAPVETVMAMGRLEAHLEGLQETARSSFAEVFEGFAGDESRARFAALFDRSSDDQSADDGRPPEASHLLA